MHQFRGSQSALEKWQLGRSRLARSTAEPELLGSAMLSLHGALEDQFRHTLAALPQLSATERSRVQDVKQVQWRELCELMQKYLGLSDRDAKYIMKMNFLRIDAGHGAEFRGSYQDVAVYVDFVRGWLGVTDDQTIQVNHSFANRCPRCQSMRINSLEVIYHRGISVVERGRGNVQTRQSGLSLQAAPPQKKKYIPTLPPWSLLMGFFLLLMAGVLLLLLPIWFYWVWKFNTTEYPRLMKEWYRTFRCEQCGHTFLLETSR